MLYFKKIKKNKKIYGNHKALVCLDKKILPPAPDQFWVLQSVCAAVQHFFSLRADSSVVKTRDTSWRLGTGYLVASMKKR